MKGYGNMMKQAQKLQQQMMEIQEKIGAMTVEGSAGGGMVKAVANGHREILEVSIDPEVVDPEDIELLEDLVVAAVNNASEKAKALSEEEMAKILPPGMGGFGLPGLG